MTRRPFITPQATKTPTEPIARAVHDEKLRVLTLLSLLDFIAGTAPTPNQLIYMVMWDLHRQPFMVALADLIQSIEGPPDEAPDSVQKALSERIEDAIKGLQALHDAGAASKEP